MEKVIVVGGGLAGLISAILIQRAGFPCVVIEKKRYPMHRVCGEYISNEAVPFLKSVDLFPGEFHPPLLNRFMLSSITGKSVQLPLDLGGFGISRYVLDHFLYEKATQEGVEFLLDTEVASVDFSGQSFEVTTPTLRLRSPVVIGAFGKRSKLDVRLKRNFLQQRSPYVGVKYHVQTDYPNDLIALHNFNGGYCGVSNVEDGKTNVCYLTHRDNVKKYKSIKEMETHVLYENPHLKNLFTNATFLFDRPETINEISFARKEAVENHMLMVGDAAGMITPLCGNGMAMAIHGAKVASALTIEFLQQKISREILETQYRATWKKLFAKRLLVGRYTQRLFGSHIASEVAIKLAITSKPIANTIIRNTHGSVF